MFFEWQSKCSKVVPAAGFFFKIHSFFSLAGGKASVRNKRQNYFKHHTCKNKRPRKISMNIVKQNVQTKANRLEESKNVSGLFPFVSCPTAAALLWSKSNDLLLWTSTSLSPKFFTKWVMWMAAVTWFITICSKIFQTGFQSKTIGLQIS